MSTGYVLKTKDINHMISSSERTKIKKNSEANGMIKLAEQLCKSGLLSQKDVEKILRKNKIKYLFSSEDYYLLF